MLTHIRIASHHLLILIGVFIYLIQPAFGAIFCFDDLHRLTKTDYGNGTIIEYTYDENGNQLERIITGLVALSVSVEPPGAGTATGAGQFLRNTNAALTAIPGSAFDFEGWKKVDGTVLSTSASYSHPVTGTETLTARFTPGVPASISTGPTAQTSDSGSPITLAATVSGSGAISYQWFRNGVAIAGATSPSLILPATSFNHAGQYTLRVSNRHGTAESTPSLLSIRMTGYDQWKNAAFTPAELTLNDPLTVGPSAVLDGAKPNLLHYAFGLNARDIVPADTTAQWWETNGAEQYFNFRYRHLLGGGGLRYTVSVSDNLSTWDETELQVERIGTPTPNNDGLTETITVRLKTPITSATPKKFMRLSVSP